MRFECEHGSRLIVSHKRSELRINDAGAGGISFSSAQYAQVVTRDRFGNDRLEVFIMILDIKGPASSLTGGLPWELADASGASAEAPFLSTGVWYFIKGTERTGARITKCLPTG